MTTDSTQSESHGDLTNQRVGDYTIIRRLGRGGMADVYLARQQSLKRNVALKILKADLARDTSYIERFQREAQSAASLAQANIVQIYEVGQSQGLHFIAQEYVVGRNLREYISRYGAIKPVMAINVLRQVALALQKSDECNVIHRDIKPENIMLSPDGEVKVTDFGLARVNDGTNQELTQIGITMGTPLYMSPEQIEGHIVDVRSDIYSLGVTAYHMLAGKPPFAGETALAIAVQHVQNKPESLETIRPDLPPGLLELVERMMAKSATDRPQNAAQLLKEIKAIKVDMDQDWDRLIETLAIENAATQPAMALSRSRMAVTRQLQAVMKGNIRSWWTDLTTILTFLLLAAVGMLLGLWTANQTPITNPLQTTAVDTDAVSKRASAREQYLFASHWSPTERDFQAVIDYFPLDDSDVEMNQTRLHVDRAKERLAEIYIVENDLKKAIEIYSGFLDATYSDRLPVVGHAGLAIVYTMQEKPDLATEEMAQIEPSQIQMLNQFLKSRYLSVRNNYNRPIQGALSAE